MDVGTDFWVGSDVLGKVLQDYADMVGRCSEVTLGLKAMIRNMPNDLDSLENTYIYLSKYMRRFRLGNKRRLDPKLMGVMRKLELGLRK